MTNLRKKYVTAILPMRRGSQRVKNKNVRKINNIPLYKVVINTLLKSKMIDKICINTDIDEVFEKYSNIKKINIIKRGKKLRGNCNINKVIKETLEYSQGEYFIQIHCTNPFLKTRTIDLNISNFLNQQKYDSFFSVTKFQKRLWNKYAKPINHKLYNEPTTQNLEVYYEENSCFYIFTRSSFLLKFNRIGKNPKMRIIAKNEAFDLDDEDDFDFANNFFKT